MGKILLGVLTTIFLSGLVACDNQGVITENQIPSIENQTISEKNDSIVINEIEGMAHAKLMVESKDILKEELPKEVKYLADNLITGEIPLSMISAYYTKSDYEKDEYDILHDYVLLFCDENSNKSVKISASNIEKPLRDYFFTSAEEVSKVNGVEVTIYHYEDKYIANLTKDTWKIDIETNELTQEEVLRLIKNILT